MALRKKGSRLIVVGGKQYRWVLSPNDDWMDIVVELASEPGQRLVARGSYNNAFDKFWLALPDPVEVSKVGQQTHVTPKLVQSGIERALASGWKPAEKGGEFKISIDDLQAAEK